MAQFRRRRRRRETDDPENHERWLVSYADFITLLFAFFVVMYGISSVNEGKYRVMSDYIVVAFRSISGAPARALMPVSMPESTPAAISLRRNPAPQLVKKEQMRNLAVSLNQALAPLMAQGKVRVTEGALGITVDINASALFAPGEARLDPGAVRALDAVGRMLATTDFPIVVEGHTDNAGNPADNLKLSEARAKAVMAALVEGHGIAADRLQSKGFGSSKPIATNETPQGRQNNRRVELVKN